MEIRILGELEVVREGRPVALPASKRTRALLGFLAATGEPHLREKLCELFWDGPDDPRAALRWSLAKLRPLVGAALAADRERVSCRASLDLHAVRGLDPRTAPLAELASAAQRFRGELLDGLDLPDCFRYQAWCAAERDSARALRLSVYDALATRLDEPEQALSWARARLAVDPLAETAHARVMSCLHRLGRTREALKHYDEARRLLAAELGVRGAAELERARQECLSAPSAELASAPLPAAAPVEAAPPRPPLVGRAAEQAELRRWVEEAAASRAHGAVLLVGEPGIGKSRLLDELAAAMRAAGGRVLTGRGYEAEMLRPYGAWIDALKLVNETLDKSGDRNQLFDAVARRLAALAPPGRPLLVLLDDLQWLDESSAALLHFCARAVEESRVLLACAARPGELADNRAALQTVRALARDGRLRRVDLQPLDAAAVGELVGDVDVARVMASSGGNPLYALEVASAMRSGRSGGTLDDLLRERLEKVEGRARDLLPFAATLGHDFEPALLAAASGLPAADLLAAADELERRGILTATTGGWDFSHDLVREAAYRSLSEPRRRLVHLQIAEALANLPDPEGARAAERAHHAALGGDVEAAARAWLTVGQRCLRVFAQAEAHKAGSRGLELLERLPPQVRAEVEIPLYSVVVFARSGTGATPELDARLARAILAADAAGFDASVQLGFHLMSMIAWRAEELDRALQNSLRAADAVSLSRDPTTAAKALATTSRCLILIERDVPRALKLAEEAKRVATDNRLAMAEVAWAAGLADHYRGLLDRSVGELEKALQLYDAGLDHWGENMCLLDGAMIALERRRFGEAVTWAERAAAVAHKLGEGSEGPFAEMLAALARRGAGEEAPVDACLQQLQDLDARTYLSYACNTLAELELELGRPVEAAAAARRALAVARSVDRKSEIALSLALLIQIEGDASLAAELQPLVDEGAALSARARRRVAAALPQRSF